VNAPIGLKENTKDLQENIMDGKAGVMSTVICRLRRQNILLSDTSFSRFRFAKS